MDTRRVLDVILRSAAGVRADACELWLLSADRARLTLAASRLRGAPTGFAEEGERAVSMELTASALLAEAMQSGAPRVVARAELDAHDGSADPFFERTLGRDTASVVVAPIAVGQRPAALLVLARERPVSSPFDEADVDATASVALLASAFLEKLQAGASPVPLRAIVDNLPAMVAYWDATLRCRFANRAYETWFGVDPEALVGHTMRELLGPLFALNAPYIERVLRGEPQEFEREIPDPRGGAPRHSQAHYIPDIVDGEVRGFCALVIDVGRRKQAEAALAFAKEQAEAANRELEAFSYSVAHDLRGPLRAMSGFAALLVEEYRESLNAEAADWLNEIVQSAAKMACLIDALLGLARIQRGPMKRERVDVATLARDEAARLSMTEPARHVEIVIEPELVVYADASLARALVCNLLGNAWKFTATCARPRIEVGRGSAPDGSGFFVRDNGAGFDMAFAAKLFVPFQRLHTVDEFPGSGIGLATVQRIAQRHGGAVRAEGAVGRGATFYVSLPHQADAPIS